MEVYRRKHRPETEYYDTGELFSRYFEERTLVETPLGPISCELVTYYQNGAVKRIFPLYGQISGFWTEKDEFSLFGEPLHLEILGAMREVYPEDLYFDPEGNLRSITIYRMSKLTLPTPLGDVRTTFGADFYESGALKSIEPIFGTTLETKKGPIHPFDPTVCRLHAENNSLVFSPEGDLLSWKEWKGRKPIKQT